MLYIFQERVERGICPLLLATLQHGNPCHPSRVIAMNLQLASMV